MEMREILFRGKRLDSGEWAEGNLVVKKDPFLEIDYCFILAQGKGDSFVTWHKVDPATVDQYTGLTDNNGKRIFEGDIVAQSWYDFDEPADDSFGEVVFSVADCSFSVLDLNKNEIMSMGQGGSYHYEVEIIGNIHDNPELIGGAEDG